MNFASPDYPVFLTAVFLIYALTRLGGARGRWARIARMVLLGDIAFTLISKDPNALWDPLGGALLRLAQYADSSDVVPAWPVTTLATRWAIGLAVVFGAIELGRRAGGWIGSDRGQALIARGFVLALALLGTAVIVTWQLGRLGKLDAIVGSGGHLFVLALLGIAIGAAQVDAFRPLGRMLVLFVASGLFYQVWASSKYGAYRYMLVLLLATFTLDYYLALWIDRAKTQTARRVLLIVSLVSNLGILFAFKYTDFFIHDVVEPGVAFANAHLDSHLRQPHLPWLHLILPAGISFHTFQSLSYTIDVYRRQLKPTRSVLQFSTFVLFFPQLVAGPIVRAQDLLPQLGDLPALDLEKATIGLFRIVIGLFKKLAIADALAMAIVLRVFADPSHFSTVEVIAGVVGFALQIYTDFSAYSDIAIGSAAVLGFTLPENFRTPYRSANLQEFWRRWHISLSTWLRDYLYITLGGSRGAAWRTYVNLSLTMLIGGLWHGPGWTYVVWGALHGFGLAVTRYFQRRTAADPDRALYLVVVCFGIATAGYALQQLVLPDDIGVWPQLIVVWLYATPLWAVLTAWLGADQVALDPVAPTASAERLATALRCAMCGAFLGVLAVLQWGEDWTWIPAALAVWALALAADIVERGARVAFVPAAVAVARRGLAVILVFSYVCLAWIFFRATSFDNALDVLRQIAAGEPGHANAGPIVMMLLTIGVLAHFFADGSFRWLRERFCALPAIAQGAVLCGAALVLRELAHPKVVPFIYFEY